MPELPEVETTRRGLVPKLEGRKLTAVVVRHPRLRWPVPADLEKRLCGRRLKAIARRGKYLLFDFSGLTQIVHLGMSGSLRFVAPDEPPTVHDHVDWIFAGGLVLRLRDPRRFGAVLLTEDAAGHALLAHLGPEPLSECFDGNHLYRASRGTRIAVKNFIMDSKRVVGVGNIYASESLFAAGIRPGMAAGRLTRPACARLAAAIKTILQAAIKAGGSSLRSDIAGQGMQFMTTLATIADLLDAPDELSDEIDDLAKAHAGLGVKAADFTPMGAALMATLAETLDAEFTPELEAAWQAAYDHFAALMIARGGFA